MAIYLGNTPIAENVTIQQGGGVTIDDTLSDTSKNPVQNKVINAALNSKADLSDIPTTLPANGGRSDTTNHQINHYLGQGNDVLAYATSDNCPYNVNTKVRIMNSPTCPTIYGYNAADNDFWYDIYKLDNLWVQIKAYDVRGNVEFINSCCNGTWKGWIRCNDGGNAATVNGLTVQMAVPANAKFTDTKVTAVGNHYTPSGGTTTSASGGSLTDITNSSSGVQVVTGVTKDAAGHVTGVTSVALKSTNTNTTYGAASTSANGLMTTGAQTLAGNKTFNGQVIPAGASAVGTAQARKIYAGTSDMTAGTTKLETGAIYLVYE